MKSQTNYDMLKEIFYGARGVVVRTGVCGTPRASSILVGHPIQKIVLRAIFWYQKFKFLLKQVLKVIYIKLLELIHVYSRAREYDFASYPNK